MLRYRRINSYFYMDTFFATRKKGKSSRGNTCCQLFVTDKGFVYVVPMRRKSDVPHAIRQFAKEIGAPDAIVCDPGWEQISQAVKQFCNVIGTQLRMLEEGTPWANKAELYIGLLKEAVRKDMRESDSPLCLWDYCIERRARINNMTAKSRFNLDGTNAHTLTFGEEGDISSLCTYGWYEWCYFRDQTAAFPANKEVMGRVLGPARGEGNEMCQWVLKSNGRIVPRRSLRPLTVAELHSSTEIQRRQTFNELIKKKLGDSINPPKEEVMEVNDDNGLNFDTYEDEDTEELPIPEIEDAVDANGRLIDQQPAYDKLINAEVMLQQGEDTVSCTVKQRSVGPDGRTSGTYDDNPYANTILYDVEFPDGQVKEYSANVIAENMYATIDVDGLSKTILEVILDCKKDESVAVRMSENM